MLDLAEHVAAILAEHVAAILSRADPAAALSVKEMRLRLESRLALPSGSLKARKEAIARLVAEAAHCSSSSAAAPAPAQPQPLARLTAVTGAGAIRAIFCASCGSLLEEPSHVRCLVECYLCGKEAA